MAKKTRLLSSTPKKGLANLLESEIFGPKDYLLGKPDDEILKIAAPLIKAIEQGIITLKGSGISYNPPKADLDEIRNLTSRGRAHIISWLYYCYDKEDREAILIEHSSKVIKDS